MNKECLFCKKTILKTSKQWKKQIYCSTQCRKKSHRQKTSKISRIQQRRSNLLQNDEMLSLIRECRRAGTIQILKGHDIDSFLETMDLVRNRPDGDVCLCHIYPVKGKHGIGLFHCRNLFYGGSHQNRKFGNRYASGGLSLSREDIDCRWQVTCEMKNNEILLKIESFLGNIINHYLKVRPVRKSKRVQLALKIADIDPQSKYEDLMNLSFLQLQSQWTNLSGLRAPDIPKTQESKYISYLGSLSRLIAYKTENWKKLDKLRHLMAIGYMALERIEKSNTYNSLFYDYYGHLLDPKYINPRLIRTNEWSQFKDLIYETAFAALQGQKIDIKAFRKELMSYLVFPDKDSR